MLETATARQRVFAVWLHDHQHAFTPTEACLLRALGLRCGSWVPKAELAEAMYRSPWRQVIPSDLETVRTHIWRIRPKLAPHWRIENRFMHGLYRLVPSD